jgi:hypothetical protein
MLIQLKTVAWPLRGNEIAILNSQRVPKSPCTRQTAGRNLFNRVNVGDCARQVDREFLDVMRGHQKVMRLGKMRSLQPRGDTTDSTDIGSDDIQPFASN